MKDDVTIQILTFSSSSALFNNTVVYRTMPIHLSTIVLLVVLSQTYGFIRSYQVVNNVFRFSKAESIAWEEVFPEATIKTFCLPEHRPLGCTVEESLADLELKPVFISKVYSLEI
jgi:hypothetical protein